MPRFREEMSIVAIDHLSVTASWDGWDPGEETKSAAYNPPEGWVILDTQVNVHSSNNGSRAVSVLAGGINILVQSTIERVYNSAINIAGNYKDKKIKGQLQAEKKERTDDVAKFQANKNTVFAQVTAKAHGSFADRKRGWEEISVTARLFYIGAPSSQALKTELEQAYRIKLDALTSEKLNELKQLNISKEELENLEIKETGV